ncbi:MAG: heme-binding protein [Bdellovibrionaceae bacterium]|nr:heme-binding protein [Bdellovibrio sp.]
MQNQDHAPVPLAEKIKSVAGLFGIRTNDEPEYMLKESEGNNEVREYFPHVLARIPLHGHDSKSVEHAFAELSDYIFGKNSLKKQMAMVLPVIQEKRGSQDYLCFILPPAFTAVSAPQPDNQNIEFETRSGEVVAAIEYSGVNTPEKIEEKKYELLKWLSEETAYEPCSEIRTAQYDPPMTIPFMRKNEIIITVKKINFSNNN